MAKTLRNGTTMTIAELEHALGFKWRIGLGAGIAETPPPIVRLQREILQLCEEFAHMKPAEMKESLEMEEELKVCFDNIGPTLWPTSQDRGAWLVDATTETSNGLYKDNLFFSDAGDRETLWTRFQTYVTAKCVTYKRTRCADNTRGKRKKKRKYATSDTRDLNDLNDDINAVDAFTTAVDEQDEPQPKQRKITTEGTVLSPQQKTVSPMRTRRGKAFGYGVVPIPETTLPPSNHATPKEVLPSVEPRSALPFGPQIDIQQARPHGPYEKSPEVEPLRVATAVELTAGLEDILTHTTLLVEYSRTTESKISLKACYTNEELFGRIDEGMPYEIADAANVVGAAKVTVPGGEVMVLHPEYGTLEQRTLRVSEFRELLQLLFSLGVNAPIELGAVVEWDEDAW